MACFARLPRISIAGRQAEITLTEPRVLQVTQTLRATDPPGLLRYRWLDNQAKCNQKPCNRLAVPPQGRTQVNHFNPPPARIAIPLFGEADITGGRVLNSSDLTVDFHPEYDSGSDPLPTQPHYLPADAEYMAFMHGPVLRALPYRAWTMRMQSAVSPGLDGPYIGTGFFRSEVSCNTWRADERPPLVLTPPVPWWAAFDGTVVLLRSLWATNYYHFLAESLPRLVPLLPELRSRPGIVILAPAEHSFMKELFRLLGLADRVFFVPDSDTYAAAEVLMPSPARCLWVAPRLVAALRAELLGAVGREGHLHHTRPPAVIVIRRKGSREVANHAALMAAVRAEFNGTRYETVEFEALPVAATVDLFHRAALVVGPHGAGLTNIMFCPAGTPVIEFLEEFHPPLCFVYMATALGLPWFGFRVPYATHEGPMTVDVPLVLHRIREAMRAGTHETWLTGLQATRQPPVCVGLTPTIPPAGLVVPVLSERNIAATTLRPVEVDWIYEASPQYDNDPFHKLEQPHYLPGEADFMLFLHGPQIRETPDAAWVLRLRNAVMPGIDGPYTSSGFFRSDISCARYKLPTSKTSAGTIITPPFPAHAHVELRGTLVYLRSTEVDKPDNFLTGVLPGVMPILDEVRTHPSYRILLAARQAIAEPLLELLGLGGRGLYLPESDTVFAPQVIMTSPPRCERPPPRMMTALRDELLKSLQNRGLLSPPGGPGLVVVIRASGAVGSSVVNHDELAATIRLHFEGTGFEVVEYDEGLSVRADIPPAPSLIVLSASPRLSIDQIEATIDLFHRAALVVGPHGAGLANLLFCPAGTPVVEFLEEYPPSMAFLYLAAALGLPWFGFTVRGAQYGGTMRVDVDMALGRIREAMAALAPRPTGDEQHGDDDAEAGG
ncbi:hypothetical protein PAPYR_3580 [Paratrimastix pyriformis]|uniref:Glycosyltransferase 61 catalytic domain-containing protein n=1 Tax=Paratrimastix pyriformis TaxID=342808 RepID=A0ABQ8UP27_9EUKA|nr:hypothetical protein PAPYR_3580 [Paratrimastix pyriformis]